jgi:hypothetical protein
MLSLTHACSHPLAHSPRPLLHSLTHSHFLRDRPWRHRVQKDASRFFDLCVEVGCTPAVDQLLAFSRWITPPHMRYRYDTNFYLCELQRNRTEHTPVDASCSRREAAAVDHQEVVELEWLTPLDALRRHANHSLQLSPPTWVTLCQLSAYHNLDHLLAEMRALSVSATHAPQLHPCQPEFQSQSDGRVIMRLSDEEEDAPRELVMDGGGHFTFRDGDRVIHSQQFATANL